MEPEHILQFRKQLLKWFEQRQRRLPWRDTHDPYCIWVSEVMLQQTQVKTVVPYYSKFLSKFPDVRRLAEADLQRVLKVWEGLGYYARARNLHRAAGMVVEMHNGNVPATWKMFRTLPGVGDYIASAVMSIAFQQAYSVVDGNVKRVLARLFQIEAPVNQSTAYKAFKVHADKLLDPNAPGIYNQAVMELGALVCKPGTPECSACPVRGMCAAEQTRTTADYPVRVIKKAVPEYHVATGVIRKNGRMLITRRKPAGLLGGLWEFPGGRVRDNETPEAACLREIREETGLTVEMQSHLTRVRHAYSHFKIVMDVYCCRYVSGDVMLDGPTDYRWIRLDEIDSYPFPGANLKFIPQLACDIFK